MTVFVFQNSAGGSITPKCSNWEVNGMVIIALAFKGTRTTQVLDGASAINLFNSVGAVEISEYREPNSPILTARQCPS